MLTVVIASRDPVDLVRARRELVNGRLVSAVGVHGLASTYTNHACRCESCTAAWRAAVAGRRERRRARTAANGGVAPAAVHGATTYSNWGCRCPVCAEGHRDMVSRRRARLRRDSASRE